MQLTLKKSGLIALALSALATLIVTMAFASSASAGNAFCYAQTVNNQNKCWGDSRAMHSATAHGNHTGVCVGADTVSGTCAPTNQTASVSVPFGQHYPWILGTAGNTTTVWGVSYP